MTDTCNAADNNNTQSTTVSGVLSLAQAARVARAKFQQASTAPITTPATTTTTTCSRRVDNQTNNLKGNSIISRGTESPTTVVAITLPTSASKVAANLSHTTHASLLQAQANESNDKEKDNQSNDKEEPDTEGTRRVMSIQQEPERDSKAAQREQIRKEYPGITSSNDNGDHDRNGQQDATPPPTASTSSRSRRLVPSGMKDTATLLRRIQSARALLPTKTVTVRAPDCDAQNSRPKVGAVGGRATSCRHLNLNLNLRTDNKTFPPKMAFADCFQEEEEEEEEDDEEQDDLVDTENKPYGGAGHSPRTKVNTNTRRQRASLDQTKKEPEEQDGVDHTSSPKAKAKTTSRHSSLQHTKKQLGAGTAFSQREADIASPTTKVRTTRRTTSTQQHNYNRAEDSAVDTTGEKHLRDDNLISPTAKARATRTRRKFSLEDNKRQLLSTPNSADASIRVLRARRPSLQHQHQSEEEGNVMGSPLIRSSTNATASRRRSDVIGAPAVGRRKGHASRGVRLSQIQQCLQADSDEEDENHEGEGNKDDPQDANDQQEEPHFKETQPDTGAGKDTEKVENWSPKTSLGNPLSKFVPRLSFGQKKHWDALE